MKQSFFDIDSTSLKTSQVTYAECNTCGLCRKCNSPKMDVIGEGKSKILVVTDFPDYQDDLHESRWHGTHSKYLAKLLHEQRIDVVKDCWHIHAVSCRPAKGKKPSSRQVGLCRPKVLKAIDDLSPSLIILAGKLAVESVIGSRWKQNLGSMHRWRGWKIPDRLYNAYICPIWSPGYVLNKIEDCPVVEQIYTKDITNLLRCSGRPQEADKGGSSAKDEESCIKSCVNVKEAEMCLKTVLKIRPYKIAFDYETTGLKPYADGHTIVSCSIATSPISAFAFCLEGNQQVIDLLKEILISRDIKKIASNLQFEEMWTQQILGIGVKKWLWDTMLMSHILDNRPRISSIKFQYYVHFGLADYDSHISPMLKSNQDSANGFNSIFKIPKKELLLYNGMDSLLEYRIAEKQMMKLKRVS